MISQIKYLGLILDEHLTFRYHLQNLKLKLHRANYLLSKIRHVKFPLLRTIYYALFHSHLRYGCQIWGQRRNEYIESILKIQNKAIRILNFKGPREGAQNLYKESKIDKVINNIIIANTRGNKLNVANVNTTIYGWNSITLKAIKQWNELQNFVKTYLFSINDNTSSVKLTPHLLLIKLLYGFGMYVSPLYHSLVIICIYLFMHVLLLLLLLLLLLFVYQFLFSFSFVLFYFFILF